MISLICVIYFINGTSELIYKTDSQIFKNKHDCQRGNVRRGGIKQKLGINIHAVLYIR